MSLTEPSDGLFGTAVELSTIERGLRRGLGTTKRCEGERSITRIGENQGFFSRVGLLQCKWPEGCSHLPNQVVVKITTLLNTIAMHNRNGSKKCGQAVKRDKLAWNSKAEKLRKWHNNEILFYESVQSLGAPSFLPTMFNGRKFDDENQDIGFICMEYAGNCQLKHIYENFTVDQIEKTLSALAEVQSVMESLPEDSKKKFTVNAYEELYSDILSPGVLSFRLDELRMLDISLTSLISQVETEVATGISTKVARKEEAGSTCIFVQGDLYSTNILWKKDENGHDVIQKIVDWQLCHYGSAAEDLTRLFITSMSCEDRRMHWERLLEEYHRDLNELLGEERFTLEELKSSYRRFFPLAALAFLGTVSEVYKAATSNCSETEKLIRQKKMANKVKGILEDILFFTNPKHV